MQKGGLELTQDELKNLTSAMKKPEFRSLLNDYLEEISDPKNKAEYEAYLEQMETSGELPPGRVLLKPQAHSCIKTHGKGEHGRSFKIFLNLCMTDKLPQPTQERKAEGSTWHLPYAVGAPRHDQDGRGKPCITFDCAFHPQAFQLGDSSSKFKQLMCETAISGANQLLKKQGEKASADYKLLKNKRCKGTTPGSILAAQASLERPDQAPKPSQERTYSLAEEGPKLYRDLMAAQLKDKPKDSFVEVPQEEEVEEVEERGEGVKTPKYKLVHSSPIGYADCIDTREKAYKRPTELRLEVQVPFLDKLSDASIDLQPRLVIFTLKDTYYLEVRLPYEVEEAKASAKFDRRRKLLAVTLPTLPDKTPLSAVSEERGDQTVEQGLLETQSAEDTREEKENTLPQSFDTIEEVKVSDSQPLWTELAHEEQAEQDAEAAETPLTEIKYKYDEEQPVEAVPTIEEISSEVLSSDGVIGSLESSIPSALEVIEDQLPTYTFKQVAESKQAYLLFHVPGLIKSSVTSQIFSEEVEIKFASREANRLTSFVFRLRFFQPIDAGASSVDKIIDYVSLKFLKQAAEDWPEAGTAIQEMTLKEAELVEKEAVSVAPVAKTMTRTCMALTCPLLYDLF